MRMVLGRGEPGDDHSSDEGRTGGERKGRAQQVQPISERMWSRNSAGPSGLRAATASTMFSGRKLHARCRIYWRKGESVARSTEGRQGNPQNRQCGKENYAGGHKAQCASMQDVGYSARRKTDERCATAGDQDWRRVKCSDTRRRRGCTGCRLPSRSSIAIGLPRAIMQGGGRRCGSLRAWATRWPCEARISVSQ